MAAILLSQDDDLRVVERQDQVISTVDKVKFFVVTSVGFFSDGWLNGGFSYIVPMFGYVYWDGLSIGMVAGMLVFGFFGDAVGRHKVYGKELVFTLLGTLMIVLTPWRNFSQQSVITWITVWRVVTGFGIGGDYPMSASLNGETSLGMSRAKLVLTSFFAFQTGTIFFAIWYIILLVGFKSRIETDISNVNYVWRLLFGIGMIPGLASLYERLSMRETTPYTKYVSNRICANGDERRGTKAQWSDFAAYFNFKTPLNRRHCLTLSCTALTWFFFDIAIYGFSLNNSNILSAIGYGAGATKYETLYNTAVGANIIAIFSLIGNFVGIFLPDTIGRWYQQLGGCLVCTIVYAVWAGVQNRTSTAGLMVLFVISSICIRAGPDNATFLIPIESFPTRVRGTAHGISAACGKLGALITAFTFGYLNSTVGLSGAIGLCSGVMLLATITATGIPEVKGLSLDDIENDIQYLSRKERLAHIAARKHLQAACDPTESMSRPDEADVKV